ncbi:DUF3298 domain-containing protein [Chryseobacterium salviniae]|uniref:DUF3298 domain-containing protein n=1 Tax=Chryseobacterium salviniae TaxID=3101750 RepID=A0ABU6HXE0_9FLAO|nr:DUF3298 domain-containing protein [Chryseobacterium sp. T9W2-O]MEC3877729.1 DUF3298 domain-containing protein [Chryseobacterium sp. T9W2-O]
MNTQMMKNTYFIWILASFSIIFACKEFGNENKTTDKNSFGRTKIDAVINEDTIKISDSLVVRYSSKLLWFPDLKNKKLLSEIYSGKEISDFSKKGLQSYFDKEKQEVFNKMSNSKAFSNVKQQQQWSYISQMNVRMNRYSFVSVQYYSSRYEAENKVQYHYNEKVFDFKNQKKLELSDILVLSEETIRRILKLSLEKTTMMQQIKVYDREAFKVLSKVNLPVSKNFYFDDSNLYFHYNMNEISRNYDIGDIILTISWEDLNGFIKPDFAERMKIN